MRVVAVHATAICYVLTTFHPRIRPQLLQLNDTSAEDAKLSYIRNLMVNYFTSDREVRDHMEGAIGTVLKFSPEDVIRIEAKKQEDESWF